MIATDAQYRVTQDRIRRFNDTLSSLEDEVGMAAWLRDAHARAIHDTVATLQEALAIYDELVSGDVEEIVVERLADLPRDLVRARLVANMDQGELARASGQSPQHVQRWERDGYSGVPMRTMLRIAGVLPLRLPVGTEAAQPAATLKDARRSLVNAGFPKEVFDRVILPEACAEYALADEVDQRLGRLFGMGAAAFVGGRGFEASPLRFKLPANAAQDRTRAYAAYIDGLCGIVAKTQRRAYVGLPTSWQEVRRLLFPDGTVDIGTAARSCWALGIGVLGLRDPVAFHGACRRRGGRATIVVKQRTHQESRWLFDLVHEVFHLVAEVDDFTLIEAAETASERRESVMELRANRFAALILTDGRVEEAFQAIATRAGGSIQRLSAVVGDVARTLELPVGVLANLVAQNVASATGRNWWGGAEKLQPEGIDDPWKVVRDTLLDEADLDALDPTERSLLLQALRTSDD